MLHEEGQLPRYMGGERRHNRGGCNRDAGLDTSALRLRRGFGPSRLEVETRVWTLRALVLRRGFGLSRLEAEMRVSGPRALMLRRGFGFSRLDCHI